MEKKKVRRNKQWEIVFRFEQKKRDGRKLSAPDSPIDLRRLFHVIIETNYEGDIKNRITYPISDRHRNHQNLLILERDMRHLLLTKGSMMGFEIMKNESGIREEGENLIVAKDEKFR